MQNTKITVECLGNPHFGTPERLQDFLGCTEEEFMMHIMIGASNLLQSLESIRSNIDLVRFTLCENDTTLYQNCVEIRLRVVVNPRVDGLPKINAGEIVRVVRDPSFWKSDTVISVGQIVNAIISHGSRVVKRAICEQHESFADLGRALQEFAPFALPATQEA
jgi:hypothetical protein